MAIDGDGGAGAGAGEGGGSFGGAADLMGGAPGGEGGTGAGTGGNDGAGGGEGGAGAAGGGEAQGGSDPDWYQQLSADTPEGEKASLRDWVKAAGVKDITGLAKVARDNQTALRESGRIKVPGEGASEQEVSAFRKAIGVPDTPEGYTLPEVKDADGNAIPLDKALIGKLIPDALELGVPAAAFEGLVSRYVAHQQAEFADFEAERQNDAKDWFRKQGDQGPAKLAAVDAAGRALGLSSDDMISIRNAIGGAKSMEMFSKLGDGMAEDVMLTGGRGRFGITGAEAGAEIKVMRDKLNTDPVFKKEFNTPGSAVRLRYDRLNQAHAEWEAKQPGVS